MSLLDIIDINNRWIYSWTFGLSVLLDSVYCFSVWDSAERHVSLLNEWLSFAAASSLTTALTPFGLSLKHLLYTRH